MNSATHFLRLPLNRPEYVAVPEAFITALAWKVFTTADEDNRGLDGLFFRGSMPSTGAVNYRSTDPRGTNLDDFTAALRATGLRVEGDSVNLSEAVLNSVLGIRIERSGVQPASPISPSFALMQNTRGLLRKQNPADIADILETMYAFGASVEQPTVGVASRWALASARRLEIDPLIRAIDHALDESNISRSARVSTPARNQIERDELAGRFDETPFQWFSESWDRLTSPNWVEALPARVWVDWATTLLRLAFGFGFLWESSWYLAVAREVQRNRETSWGALKSSLDVTVPWVSSRAGTSARDVTPKLSRRIYKSELVRHAIDSWIGRQDSTGLGFSELIQAMRDDTAMKSELLTALNSNEKPNSGSNLWEAVKYALVTRDASGRNPDYYGLLQSSGRYSTVSPGTEWIAVVASLACGAPKGSTDVGQVMRSLRTLGMQPELADLIALLERAGMARGSADADRGVIVESAF